MLITKLKKGMKVLLSGAIILNLTIGSIFPAAGAETKKVNIKAPVKKTTTASKTKKSTTWSTVKKPAAVKTVSKPLTIPENFFFYPKLKTARHLYVIKDTDLKSRAEEVMIYTLQGILAQKESKIYIEALSAPGLSNDYKFWLDKLNKDYGITYEYVNDPWQLISKFKGELNDSGFVVYNDSDRDSQSINVATSVAGVERWVAVEKSIVDKAQQMGLKKKLDVTPEDKDLEWCFKTYKNKFSKKVLFHQTPNKTELRDYAVATKGFCFYQNDFVDMEFIVDVFKWAEYNIPIFGWTEDELGFVSANSMFGKITIGSDWSHNLSVLSGIDLKKPIKQVKQKTSKIVGKPGKHYATIIMSDGDNVQWYQRGFIHTEAYYGSKNRGNFKMGWGINPSLSGLAPTIMQQIYNEATARDQFLTGVSGVGYINATEYSKKDLESFAAKTNLYMKRSDLRIINLLDNYVDTTAIQPFGKQPNIDGGIWMVGEKYIAEKGAVYWANGKPFVTFRDALWDENPKRLAHRINSYKRDYKKIEGYSAIIIHPWSMNMNDVQELVDSLDPNVELVLPTEFIDMIKRYVPKKDVPVLKDKGHDDKNWDYSKINNEYLKVTDINALQALKAQSFNFDKDTEGWKGVTLGKQYDEAKFDPSISYGANSGALKLQGSDLGKVTEKANSYFYNRIEIPQNDIRMSFWARSGGASDDSNLRVRVVKQDGKIDTIMGYTLVSGEKWVNFSLDLSSYKGQKIGLVFEQNDSGEGSGEFIFVDNIEFEQDNLNLKEIFEQNKNVSTGKPVFSFDHAKSDTEAWTGQGLAGQAKVGDLTYSGVAGSLYMDGTDKSPDTLANSRFHRKVKVPDSDKAALTFWARSGGPKDDTNLRVRVIDASGNDSQDAKISTVLPWTLIAGEKWVPFRIDLKSFKNKEMILVFEQDDDGDGTGEILFVDDIKVGTSTQIIPGLTDDEIMALPVSDKTVFQSQADMAQWIGKAIDARNATNIDLGFMLEGQVGDKDGNANALMYNKVKIPSDVANITINVRSHEDGASKPRDTDMRVRAIKEDNSVETLLDWTTITGPNYVDVKVNVEKIKGQTVTLVIEQDDNGVRSGIEAGEYLFVKMVVISNNVPAAPSSGYTAPRSNPSAYNFEWDYRNDIANITAGSIRLFTFDANTEGWRSIKSSFQYDEAVYDPTITYTSTGGSIKMQGSDLGYGNSTANACFYNKIQLPDNNIRLSFWARSGSAGDNTYLKVRVIDGNGAVQDVLPYTLVQGNNWVNYNLDLSAYRNQNVGIVFEQDDNGEGAGEILFIDNIDFEIDNIDLRAVYEMHAAADTSDVEFNYSSAPVDAEGWIAEALSGQAIVGTISRSATPGALYLAGEDGTADSLASSRFHRKVLVPDNNSASLTFWVRSEDSGDDTNMRLRIFENTGSDQAPDFRLSTAVPWTRVSGTAWVGYRVDMRSYKGKNVILVFEQDDDDDGAGDEEKLFIDDVRVGAGTPIVPGINDDEALVMPVSPNTSFVNQAEMSTWTGKIIDGRNAVNIDLGFMLEGQVGTADGNANTLIFNKISIPASATNIKVNVRSHEDGSGTPRDSNIRIRAIKADNTVVLLTDWTTVTGPGYVDVNVGNAANFNTIKGETVILVIEQDDNGIREGVLEGEYLFIRRVTVEESPVIHGLSRAQIESMEAVATLNYTFGAGGNLNGWTVLDIDTAGTGGGRVLGEGLTLEGNDSTDNADPNCVAYRKISIPDPLGGKKIRVHLRTFGGTSNFRIRVVDESMNIRTLTPEEANFAPNTDGWSLISEDNYLPFTADMTQFEGQNILIIFEQDGDGAGNYSVVYDYTIW